MSENKDYRMEFIRSLETRLACLDPEVVRLVADAATKVLADYEITDRCTDLAPLDDPNAKTIKKYCACLLVDGKSQKTIKQYRRATTLLSEFAHKPFQELGAYDIRYYLACEKDRGISNTSLENTRRYLSAFFQWMLTEEMIPKNPMAAIKPIKCTDEVKLPFSDTEIDAIRSACQTSKDRAVVEMLLSSEVRVTELSLMNVADVDLTTMTVHVMHGKGDKERITYITPVAKMHLEKYISDRKETGEALFYNHSHERLTISGIRYILKQLQARSGVDNVHPHRFRRTFATGLAARGMSIHEIQKLLGHSDISTTMEYVSVSTEGIKASYNKYIA